MILLDLNYNQELSLILIENLIIGVSLLLVGLIVKFILERLKTKQSLEAELNKLRVNKIGECFAVHSKYAKLLDSFINSLENYKNSNLDNGSIIEKLAPKVEELTEAKREVEVVTASHKFWLGDEIHQKALKFNKSFPDFCDVFHQGKFKRCVELKMSMDTDMMDVDDVMWMLNKKIRKSRRRKN